MSVGLLPSALVAQAPARLSVGAPIATLTEEFSGLYSMRELADGRVILSDNRENRLVVADFTANSVRGLGRPGDGPGEFRRTTRLFPLSGDSTLMASIRSPWIVIDASGALSTLSPGLPVVAYFRDGLILVRGTDAFGGILTAREPPRRPGQSRIISHLVLVARATLKLDTIGRVDAGRVPRQTSVAEVAARGDVLDAYPTLDHFLLAPDGWVVVVRFDPYRVDWRSPDGHWINGAPVSEPQVVVNAREKAAFLASRALSPRPVAILAPGVGYGGPPPPRLTFEWPEAIPPFNGRSAIFATPHGEVVVQRTPTAEVPNPMYDVFNRRGSRAYQVALTADRKILGFGNGVVYVITTDAVGLQRLSSHRWPLSGTR
jgi:hypothetical protein